MFDVFEIELRDGGGGGNKIGSRAVRLPRAVRLTRFRDFRKSRQFFYFRFAVPYACICVNTFGTKKTVLRRSRLISFLYISRRPYVSIIHVTRYKRVTFAFHPTIVCSYICLIISPSSAVRIVYRPVAFNRPLSRLLRTIDSEPIIFSVFILIASAARDERERTAVTLKTRTRLVSFRGF